MGIAGAGAALVHALGKEAGIARRIKKSSPQTISSFRDGTEGRICGKVAASKILRAPLSGRECVAYELIVETKGFENDNVWGVRHRHSHATEFTLEDTSGHRVAVVPEPVEIWVAPDFLVNNGEGKNKLQRRLGSPLLEQLLHERIGKFEIDPSPDSARTYRSTPTHLVIRGSRKLPVLLTNRLE